MQSFPHHYRASAGASPEGEVRVAADGLETFLSQAPVQFGGPGDHWSPEDLLVAAVADCFVLTFRAIAEYSGLSWTKLDCSVEGTLDRVEGATRFTAFAVDARLDLPDNEDADKAHKLMEKAEASCLITNSLTAEITLSVSINAE
ncbi:OsmC family protein [Microbulbifer sp. SAOS-129_SWC]|uniref:OsmC family protein n=1 Tax=Microbulbifer sp. SAOS-129_SWC TaxID=3145235 RepID=UPI0032163CBE